MAYLGQSYRTYALDFWGFGESRKKRTSFTVSDFVSLVEEFMENLGITRAPLVGHSMGGTVSLSFAIEHPDRASQVVVIGSPIHGSSLAMVLKLAGFRPVACAVYHLMWALKLGIRSFYPLVTTDPRWPEMISRDLSRTTLESFLLSIASLRRTDLRPRLGRVRVPVMGMYGDRDVIVQPGQWQALQAGIPPARIERFNRAGHFIMLDQPNRFMETLKSFLDRESPA
jgi:pimeloyl-ACP methyl ester carboxylesterase